MSAFAQGDTFCGGRQVHGQDHLWIVINNPAQHEGRALYVNVTTLKGRFAELTCVLQPADHPFIRHASYVRFADAKTSLAIELEEAERRNLIQRNQPASASLIQWIRQAALVSPRLDPELRALL